MKNNQRGQIGRTMRLTVVLASALLGAGTLQAAQLVTFARGQSIVVQSSEKRDGWYFFTLDGGGQVGVPLAQVASVTEYEAPPPAAPASPVAPAPGVAAAHPAAAPGRPMAAGTHPAPGQGSPMAAGTVAPGSPGGNPVPATANTMAPGQEDWRYKARMSGGPRIGGAQRGPYGIAAPGGRVPFGVQRPGQQRREPPGQKNPHN
jgi:hypothetical protein